MNNKELIIHLIQQDLKYNQLLSGLERVGLYAEDLHLNLLDIISELMNVPEGKKDDAWTAIYVSFMQQAIEFEVSANKDTLKPLAIACYRELQTLLEDSN
jgi:hypothetical protein